MSEAAINRALNDDERQLLATLTARTLAEETGCTVAEACDVLAEMAAKGQVLFAGDAVTVNVVVAGNVLVKAARDWTAFHAAHPGHNPWGDKQ